MYKVKSIQELISTLQESGSAIFNGLHFSLSEKSLDITTWSSYSYLENITKQNSRNELEKLRSYIQDLTKDHTELNRFLNDRQVSFSLCFDTGKGGVLICKELENKIEWFI